ncbi:lipopolysaccharide biosynthesis protein [Croceibacter atlanticus]|uniref:lipopolysaccharide biosynthesis protein n=1 Tax=Croceibacter atlanticus TaxID=313588 RepID=UPI002491A7D0|nr:lipopolysaccharide biosynthesis protein [Croceibacter atlanticus]
MSLGKQTLGGFTWTFISNIATKFLGLFIGIVLARLLTPKDFGLVAMLYVFFEVSNSFVNSGFSQALIREDVLSEKDKATAFNINILVSISFYALLWFCAPAIADFYENEKLVLLARVMGITIIINAFTIVQRADITHKLLFKKLSVILVTANVIAGIVGIAMAYMGYGVWSLASKYIVMAFMTSFLFYVMNPWYPKFFIIRESFKRLFGFGSKLFLSGLINTIYDNIYKLIIGKYFSAVTLGLYTQAKLYVTQVTLSAVSTIQTVTYPILSKAKNEPQRLKNAYRKIIIATSFVIFPITIAMGLLAKPLILVAIGEQWVDAIPFLQILCVSGVLYHLHAINLNILKVLGRSDLFLKLEIIKKINITIAILIGINFGIWGLLIASVISSYIALLINMYYTNKHIDYSYANQFSDLLPIFLQTIPMVLAIYAITLILGNNHILILILSTVLGIIVYLGTAILFKSKSLKSIIDVLGTKFPQLQKINL